jgi:hypothetical protein
VNQLLGTLVFAVLAVGVVIYVVKSYASAPPQSVARHFGLDVDEHAAQRWVGEIDDDSERAPRVTVLLTSKGRLVIVCEPSDEAASHRAFDSPDDIVVRHLGAGPRRVRGGPSARFEFAARDGAPLRVLLHESALQHLAGWQTAEAGAA